MGYSECSICETSYLLLDQHTDNGTCDGCNTATVDSRLQSLALIYMIHKSKRDYTHTELMALVDLLRKANKLR